jgi:hypothetical protein
MAVNAKVNIYLPNDPLTAIPVLCTSVNVSGKKSLELSPSANVEGPVKIQTQSQENLIYAIKGVHFPVNTPTVFTWQNLLELYRHKFDNTNPAYLEVTYGTFGGATNLTGQNYVLTKIPVILDSFNFPIDVGDSRDGYMPVGSITLKETGKD